MIVLMILVVLILFQWMRSGRDAARIHKYRYRLFALRDRLRRIAIEDTTLGRNWLFPYLDSTLSRAIHALPDLSAWQALCLIPVAYYRRDQLFMIHKYLASELEKAKNAPFKKIYEEMWNEISNHMIDRHFLMTAETIVLGRAFEGIRKVQARLRKRERRSLESVLLEQPQGASRDPATAAQIFCTANR
jgi:hypothetical protein